MPQNFTGAKIKTGSGGSGHDGARGGNIGSNNHGVSKQIFDKADLTTGKGGSGHHHLHRKDPSKRGAGGDGGEVGGHNVFSNGDIDQDFIGTTVNSGSGGKGRNPGKAGDVGGNNRLK